MATSTPATPAHGNSEKSWYRNAFDYTASAAGLTRNEERNTHRHLHVEQERAHKLRTLQTQLTTLRNLPIPPASTAVDAVQQHHDTQNTATHIQTLEDTNTNFASDISQNASLATLLQDFAANPTFNHRTSTEPDTMETVAAACGRLAPVVRAAVGLPERGFRTIAEVAADVAGVITRMRNLQSARGGYQRHAGTAVLSNSNEGRQLSSFRDHLLGVVTAIDSAQYWQVANIPRGTEVSGALEPVRNACIAYIIAPNNMTIVRGTAAQADTLHAAIDALARHIEGAPPPPENIEIRTNAPGYRISRWVRGSIAAIVGVVGVGTPIAEVAVKDFRPIEYTTRNTVGRLVAGETFLNPYRNYNMKELEEKWVETAGANREHLDGGTADTTKLSRVERVAADLVLNNADINKINNAHFKKAVEEKIKTTKGNGVGEEREQKKEGKEEEKKERPWDAINAGNGYMIQRIGNKLIITTMKKRNRDEFYLYVDIAGDNHPASVVSVEGADGGTKFEYTLDTDLQSAAEIGAYILPKGKKAIDGSVNIAYFRR